MIFKFYYAETVQNFKEDEDYNTIKASLKGTPFLYEDARFVRDAGPDTVWKRPKEICKRPFFIKGKPSRFDVVQGRLGDCWALAPFQALASNHQLFKRVVPRQGFGRNYVGAFHFRFYKLGFWYDVVIDDRLPVNKSNNRPIYAHSMNLDIFWGALLEKALSKFFSAHTYGYEYGSLHSGLRMTSFQSLTGGIVETIDRQDYQLAEHIIIERLNKIIRQSYSDGALIVATTPKKGKKGLLGFHSYAVTELYEVNDDRSSYYGKHLVRLMNPLGHKEWQGEWSDDDHVRWKEIDLKIRHKRGYTIDDDGEFWMSEDDFFTYFKFMCICHLSPRNYVKRLQFEDDNSFPWYLTILRGEWVNNITTGGADKSVRYKNPQYIFTVGKKGGKYFDPCPTMIELTMWSKISRRTKSKIAFYVYDLSSTTRNPPFRQPFFLNNKALNEFPDFDSSFSRCFIQSFHLLLGKRYLLLPCTLQTNFEAVFSLRIFSHYEVKVSDGSVPKISKSLPSETDSTNEVDKELVELFFKASEGKGEIDWIGLRDILNDVLGKSTDLISFFISYLFKLFANIFLPNTSYDDIDGELLFSKDECRKVIAMLDHDHSGTINVSEFSNLWNKIGFWTKVYDEYKEKEHGSLPTSELRDALSGIGYDVSTHIVHSFSYLYADDQSYISLKDFMLCGVALETVLTLCAKKKREDENIVFTLHEWVKRTLIL